MDKKNKSSQIENQISGLIIAAGLSSRIKTFKPLLNWEGKTFLGHIIDKLLVVTEEIVIVCGYKSELIEEFVINYYQEIKNKIRIVDNSDYEDGMFTSIKKGVSKVNNDWVLYHQIDQPNLPNEFYIEFIKQIDERYNWIQPKYNNRNGHPILFNSLVKNSISIENYNSTLREISKKGNIKKKYWNTNFEEVLTDIDTQKDFINMGNRKYV